MDYNNLPLGLRVQTQIPLDVKEYVLNEATLKDLGTSNNLAYTYVKGLIIYCFAENTRYEWNEVPSGLENTGLLPTDFTYPNGVVAFGVTYSNKKYNFFKVNVKADGSETKVNSGLGVTVSGTGTIEDPYVLSSDLSSKVDKNTSITAGTFSVITYDSKGLVTSGRNLLASDVPILNQDTTGSASTITGTLPQTKIDNLLSDLTARELISNKQNNLNPDPTNTKYPTVTAVISAIAGITSGNVTSEGTLNYLQKITADSELGNSIIYDDGNNAIIGPTTGYSTATINSNDSTGNLTISSYTTDADTTKRGLLDLTIDGDKTSLLTKFGSSSAGGEFELYSFSDIATNLEDRAKTGIIIPSLDGTRGSFNVSNYITSEDNLFQVHSSGYSIFGEISSTIDYSLHKLYISGGVFADSFVKDGGTSTQFLKADGSIDSNTYLTTASASATYEPIINAGTSTQYWKGNKTWATLDTSVVTENTNLYFTTSRARTSLSFTAGSGGYNSSTGVITIPTNTNQLTNGAGYITGYSETDTLQSVTNRGNSTSQNITAAGFFNSSDMRLKELVDYQYNVSDIKPITYVWKDNSDKRKKIGYSAQEVQKVLPEAVKKDGTGMFSVDYIQILVAKVHALELKLKKHGLE